MKFLTLVCCGVLGVFGANAQTTNGRSLTLQEVIQQAVEHNFSVEVSRYQPKLDQLTLGGDYGAFDPTFTARGSDNNNASGGGFNTTVNEDIPASQSDDQNYQVGFNGLLPSGLTYSLNTTVDKISGSNPFGTTNSLGQPIIISQTMPDQWNSYAGITLSQPILKGFWGYSAAEYQIALDRKSIKMDELAFRTQLLQTVTDTEKAYYELIYDYENIKVQEAALELAERLVSENKRKVEVGAMAPLDEKQAESQAESSRADLISAYGLLETQQNTLKALITDQYRDWHDSPIIPAQKLIAVPQRFDIQESWRKGITTRPELLQAKVNLEKLGITVKNRFNNLLPSVTLFGNYGRSGVAGNLGDSWNDIQTERLPSYQFGGQISIPLANRSARYSYKAAKEQAALAEVQFRSTEQGILVGIDNAVKAVNTDYQRIQSNRAAREYAELALEAEQKKLQVGKSTSFQVLQLQKDLTTARTAEIRSLADYNKDLSEFFHQEGSTLDRFNLNVRIY